MAVIHLNTTNSSTANTTLVDCEVSEDTSKEIKIDYALTTFLLILAIFAYFVWMIFNNILFMLCRSLGCGKNDSICQFINRKVKYQDDFDRTERIAKRNPIQKPIRLLSQTI